ncbi:MAG: peptidylprolyl isomerase [Clostridia bacterium]|nr:peptidylprolyl isomerase [Clostridia bacterium]
MQSPFHTEAPEKVREVPEVAPANSHHGEGPRGVFLSILFLALLALLVWGCTQVFMDPTAHYPYHTIDRSEPAQQPSASQSGSESSSGGASSTTTNLQPVTILAPNTGVSGTDVPEWDNVVARFGDHELTNQQFILYYWDVFYNLYSSYGSELFSMLNITMPFDQQTLDGMQTWHQYFSGIAVDTWKQTMLLCDEANKAGFALTDDQIAALNASVDSIDNYLQEGVHDSRDSYLQQMFDPCITEEAYRAYNQALALAKNYANSRYIEIYDENYDETLPLTYCINVRHILISAEDSTNADSMAAAKQQAEDLYALWQQDPTEDNFITLATENTQDPGSQSTGGLYEDVYPGEMVTTFNDWCFDESRQPGDHGIVETEYGYHIMYFVGQSETVYEDPNDAIAGELYDNWLDELFAVEGLEDITSYAVFTQKAELPTVETTAE